MDYEMDFEKFNIYFQKGTIEQTEIDNVPGCVIVFFKDRLGVGLPCGKMFACLSDFFVIKHQNDSITYIAIEKKANNDEEIYWVNFINQNKTRHGNIEYKFSEHGFSTSEAVGNVFVSDGSEKLESGTEAILMMHAISQSWYKIPIRSNMFYVEQNYLWDELCRQGKAKLMHHSYAGQYNKYIVLG